MPIYAYRCDACGHAKDVLQKMSDPPLVVCPACGAACMTKQVTAAGFQLKGSGWYVTDFRGGSNAAGKDSEAKSADKGEGKDGGKESSKAEGSTPADNKTATASEGGSTKPDAPKTGSAGKSEASSAAPAAPPSSSST